MDLRHAAKWIVGALAVGVLLLVVSLFVADRRLTPPFDEAQLEPIEVPVGAPLAEGILLFSSDAGGNLEIYARVVEGAAPRQLTNNPDFDSWRPRISPDRSTILFYRTPAGVGDTDTTQASLWMISSDGAGLVEVLPERAHGWTRQGHAEWSPTGAELVMMGERPQGHQIWVTSIDGRAVRSLVSDPGENTDPTWDAEGRRVLYIACPETPCVDADREIFAIESAGSDRIQITNDDVADTQPRFSPDGSQIVMRSLVVAGDEDGEGAVWDIRVVPTNRSRPPERMVGDDSVSSSPVWLDDQTVAFHRVERGRTDADIVSVRVTLPVPDVVLDGPANQLYPAP